MPTDVGLNAHTTSNTHTPHHTTPRQLERFGLQQRDANETIARKKSLKMVFSCALMLSEGDAHLWVSFFFAIMRFD